MLTEAYIEALLIDEELADQVWETWNEGEIDNQTAFLAWARVAGLVCTNFRYRHFRRA